MSREEPTDLLRDQPVTVMASRQYASGTRTSEVYRCPADANFCRTLLDRESWPNRGTEEIISVRVEISMDAGASWRFFYGFKARGGQTMRNDVEDTQSGCIFPLPNVGNPSRLIRITTSNTVELRTRLEFTAGTR